MEKRWESLEEYFLTLNSSENRYLVLRNYENLFEPGFLSDHPDIDFLCQDREMFIEESGAAPRIGSEDRIHRMIRIGEMEIPVDIRTPGDGYYDTEWEKHMLEHRVLYEGKCYVMSQEDYFYSLIYHGLIQKKTLSDDYARRLKTLGEKMNVHSTDWLSVLEEYMRERSYYYSYPEKPYTIFQTANVDPTLIRDDRERRREREEYEKDASGVKESLLHRLFFRRRGR